jgi:hypothetical protein
MHWAVMTTPSKQIQISIGMMGKFEFRSSKINWVSIYVQLSTFTPIYLSYILIVIYIYMWKWTV